MPTPFVAILGLVATAPVHAADRYNSLPGVACYESAPDGDSPLYRVDGVRSKQQRIQHVSCPFVMSSGGKHFLGTQTKLAAKGSGCTSTGSQPTVTISNRNSTQSSGCTLFVLGQGNTVLSAFTVRTTGVADKQVLTFAMPPTDFTGKTLYADCDLAMRDPVSLQDSVLVAFGVPSCDL